MNVEEIARKYALRNAVEHGGKCNPGAVIGKIFAEEEFENISPRALWIDTS